MKKTFLAVVLTVVMAASLVACSGKSNSNSNKATETPAPTNSTEPTKAPSGNESGTTVEDAAKKLEAAIAAALGENYICDTEVASDELYLVGLYDIDMEQVNAVVAKMNSISSVNPDTVVIVECKDGYVDTVLGYFQEYYTNAQEYQKLYPFAVEKVNNTRIYQAGNTVMLVIAGGYTPENEAEVESFVEAEYAKADEAVKSVLGYLPENLVK